MQQFSDKNSISVDELYSFLDDKNLIILDATIKKVTSKREVLTAKKQIKNARFFDIKNTFSEVDAPFPNTMLSAKEFEKKTQDLGIHQDAVIVVYDDIGIYSSARVWWMFKSMGHKNISVLDGGLPQWIKEGYPIETPSEKRNTIKKGNFTTSFNASFFCDKKEVLEAITNQQKQIIDARSRERFYGITPEPRKEVRSGHIPNAVNLPYTALLEDGKLASFKELKQRFSTLAIENKQLIFSCGSGITACVLALGATIAGYKNISVYDGSWTEWGSIPELPIEK